MSARLRPQWGSVVFWSVISAAFIGPGTVTTAALAGHGYGMSLLWALVFSTIACFVLQEASARLTIASGRDLAGWIGAGSSVGSLLGGGLVAAAVIVGCAAYEAGNLLGAAAGLGLVTQWPAAVVGSACAGLAVVLLWWGNPTVITSVLTGLVALMGVAFVGVAVGLGGEIGLLLRGATIPHVPAGAELLVLGLVGTTVVPYNLFLGSGLARGREIGETRVGLAVAIGLGGVISMAVVIAGAAVRGDFDFARLAQVLEAQLGAVGPGLLAVGLFAAGLSSAITAPWAAAMTARCLAGGRSAEAVEERWGAQSWRFRGVWGGVVGCGVAFVLARVQPVPAIVAAQALNGLVLPFAAGFLFLALHDRRAMGLLASSGWRNAATLAIVAAVTLLGAMQVIRAGLRVTGVALDAGSSARALAASAAVTLVVVTVLLVRAYGRSQRGDG